MSFWRVHGLERHLRRGSSASLAPGSLCVAFPAHPLDLGIQDNYGPLRIVVHASGTVEDR